MIFGLRRVDKKSALLRVDVFVAGRAAKFHGIIQRFPVGQEPGLLKFCPGSSTALR